MPVSNVLLSCPVYYTVCETFSIDLTSLLLPVQVCKLLKIKDTQS